MFCGSQDIVDGFKGTLLRPMDLAITFLTKIHPLFHSYSIFIKIISRELQNIKQESLTPDINFLLSNKHKNNQIKFNQLKFAKIIIPRQ